MKNASTATPTPLNKDQRRASARQRIALPARLTWKDQRGTPRFASVVTLNISDFGVYVECESPISISLYRLVHFQFERDARESHGLSAEIGHGRALSAVYRVHPPTASGIRQGFALRFMIDPSRYAGAPRTTESRATA